MTASRFELDCGKTHETSATRRRIRLESNDSKLETQMDKDTRNSHLVAPPTRSPKSATSTTTTTTTTTSITRGPKAHRESSYLQCYCSSSRSKRRNNLLISAIEHLVIIILLTLLPISRNTTNTNSNNNHAPILANTNTDSDNNNTHCHHHQTNTNNTNSSNGNHNNNNNNNNNDIYTYSSNSAMCQPSPRAPLPLPIQHVMMGAAEAAATNLIQGANSRQKKQAPTPEHDLQGPVKLTKESNTLIARVDTLIRPALSVAPIPKPDLDTAPSQRRQMFDGEPLSAASRYVDDTLDKSVLRDGEAPPTFREREEAEEELNGGGHNMGVAGPASGGHRLDGSASYMSGMNSMGGHHDSGWGDARPGSSVDYRLNQAADGDSFYGGGPGGGSGYGMGGHHRQGFHYSSGGLPETAMSSTGATGYTGGDGHFEGGFNDPGSAHQWHGHHAGPPLESQADDSHLFSGPGGYSGPSGGMGRFHDSGFGGMGRLVRAGSQHQHFGGGGSGPISEGEGPYESLDGADGPRWNSAGSGFNGGGPNQAGFDSHYDDARLHRHASELPGSYGGFGDSGGNFQGPNSNYIGDPSFDNIGNPMMNDMSSPIQREASYHSSQTSHQMNGAGFDSAELAPHQDPYMGGGRSVNGPAFGGHHYPGRLAHQDSQLIGHQQPVAGAGMWNTANHHPLQAGPDQMGGSRFSGAPNEAGDSFGQHAHFDQHRDNHWSGMGNSQNHPTPGFRHSNRLLSSAASMHEEQEQVNNGNLPGQEGDTDNDRTHTNNINSNINNNNNNNNNDNDPDNKNKVVYMPLEEDPLNVNINEANPNRMGSRGPDSSGPHHPHQQQSHQHPHQPYQDQRDLPESSYDQHQHHHHLSGTPSAGSESNRNNQLQIVPVVDYSRAGTSGYQGPSYLFAGNQRDGNSSVPPPSLGASMGGDSEHKMAPEQPPGGRSSPATSMPGYDPANNPAHIGKYIIN